LYNLKKKTETGNIIGRVPEKPIEMTYI